MKVIWQIKKWERKLVSWTLLSTQKIKQYHVANMHLSILREIYKLSTFLIINPLKSLPKISNLKNLIFNPITSNLVNNGQTSKIKDIKTGWLQILNKKSKNFGVKSIKSSLEISSSKSQVKLLISLVNNEMPQVNRILLFIENN